MPPPNARLKKFKAIIEEINTQSNEKSNYAGITSTEISSSPKSKNISTSTPSAASIKLLDENSVREQKLQVFRNRRLSCSSCSSSEKDFSPASDDDKEYIPDPQSDSSESELSIHPVTKCPPQFSSEKRGIKRDFLPKSLNLSEKSSSSSSSGSSGSSSSDSSSSDSSSSDSDSDDFAATQAKKKCIEQTKTALQELAQNYSYTSSSEEEETVDPSIPLNNLPTEPLTPRCSDKYPVNSRPTMAPEASLFNDTNQEDTNETSNAESQLQLWNPPTLRTIAMETVNTINNTQEFNVTADPIISSETDNLNTQRKKKGSKKAKAKMLRNLGQEYKSVSVKQKVISKRRMGPPCSDRCRLKCSDKIPEKDRIEIFEKYWKWGSLPMQREFIARHIAEIKPKYQYKKIDNNRKPKHAFYLTINGKKQRVCKTLFKSTLDINDRPIRTVVQKLNSFGVVEPDFRGKHDNHGTKLSAELLSGVKSHIDSIPRIESHYLRKQTTRQYIEAGKSVTDLYADYVNDRIINGSDYVKLHQYRKVFKEDYNISFFTPKKDQCEDCVAYKNAEPPEKEKLEANYLSHLKEKELCREEKAKDKELADENNRVACYDLQAMLPVPRGEVSTFYYKSKLNCLDFTISELKMDNTDCFFWNEVEGQKGANEIGSCVLKYIEKVSTSSLENKNITFYSDNCCGQQKNQFMFSMYIYAVKHFQNIQSITHKFLIKGHTQNENDTAHSTIERQIKKMLKSGPIYVPDQYIHAIREAKKKGNKYNVVEMSHTEFYDIKNLQEYKLTRNVENQVIKTGDIKVIRVEKTAIDCNTLKVSYKTSYTQEQFKEVKLQRNVRARPQLKRLYTAKLPLAERKKDDLRSLLRKNVIPAYYASYFYNSIL